MKTRYRREKINVQRGDVKTAKKSMYGKIFILELFPKMFLVNRRLQDPVKCNICKKTLKDQVIFLFADKHKNFLLFHAIAFGGRGQACPKYPKY